LKVLSLLQPWASLVVMGAKQIETRSWNTTHRGVLLIHASKGKAGGILAEEQPFKKHIEDFNKLPFGAIIGQVTLTDVMRTEELRMTDERINALTLEEKAFGDYTSGRYAWMFEEAVMFPEFFSARGSVNLWNCPPFLEKEIRKLS
jgi:activating signal cointegrator 1